MRLQSIRKSGKERVARESHMMTPPLIERPFWDRRATPSTSNQSLCLPALDLPVNIFEMGIKAISTREDALDIL